MSSKKWLAVAALVFVPLAATAQQKQSQYTPADATAPVSAIGYESAFKSYRASGDENQSPDKVWRSANAEMGKLGGHAGHMKNDGAKPGALPRAGSSQPEQDGVADNSKHY